MPFRKTYRRKRRGYGLSIRRSKRSRTSKIKAGVGVTKQRDSQVQYLKRRKRVPRSTLRLVRTIKNVAEKSLGCRTVVFRKRQQFVNSDQDLQATVDWGLYTAYSETAAEKNDINKIMSLENVGNPTAAAGQTVDDTTQFIFHQAHLSFTISNSSYDITNGLLFNQVPCLYDIYELSSSKTWEGATEVSPVGCYQTVDTDTKPLNNAIAQSIAINLKGITPFDLPQAAASYGLVVRKKTQITLNVGEIFTYHVHDNKRHSMNKNYILNKQKSNLPNLTKWIMVIAKGPPNQTLGATNPLDIRMEFKVDILRKYLYKIEGIHEDRDYYELQT